MLFRSGLVLAVWQYGQAGLSAGESSTLMVSGGGGNGTPISLQFVSVLPGSPRVGEPFQVTLQAVDANGAPQNVSSDVAVTLSLKPGVTATGSLGGQVAQMLRAGAASVAFPLGGPASGQAREWPGYAPLVGTLARWLVGSGAPAGVGGGA